MTSVSILEKLQFFAVLDSDEKSFLSNYIEEKKFKKGEVILPQGRQNEDLYLIIAGKVSVDIILPGEDYKKNITELGKGQVFGEVSFLTDSQSTASIKAKESCICLVFSRKTLEMLRVAQPEIAYKIEQEITNQAASKVIININSILDFLKNIPKDPHYPFDHTLYLENKAAEKYNLKLSDLTLDEIRLDSFFPRLTKEQKTHLLSMMAIKSYDKGYRFSEKEAETRKIGFIYSGAIMFFIKNNKKLKKSIAVLAIGELFLQNFLNEDFQQVADFLTCENTILFELDLKTYEALKISDPPLFYAISEKINRNIASAVYIVNRQFLRINCEYNQTII